MISMYNAPINDGPLLDLLDRSLNRGTAAAQDTDLAHQEQGTASLLVAAACIPAVAAERRIPAADTWKVRIASGNLRVRIH